MESHGQMTQPSSLLNPQMTLYLSSARTSPGAGLESWLCTAVASGGTAMVRVLVLGTLDSHRPLGGKANAVKH